RVAAERKAAREREVRRGSQEEGRLLARRRDRTYAAGCMLDWAEGEKWRNSARMSNSDPELLALFADLLRQHFGVRDEQISIYCNLFADDIATQSEIERFWLDRLRLPKTSLRKSVEPASSACTARGSST